MNIIYCRKSSEDSTRQVASIDSQKTNLLELAKRNNLTVSKIFTESMSAKKPGRPEFEKIIRLIERNPGSFLLVWKLDRLARNPVDGGKIAWFLQNKVIAKIITPERVHLPEDNSLISAMEFGMANQYIRDLSTNVKRGNKTKLEKGELPGAAPLGYLDNKLTKKKEVDPIKAPLIAEAFQLYSTGSYSQKQVNEIMYQKGLRTKGGYKIAKSQIDNILHNPFYSGIIRRNGQLYQGQHQPIISKTLFDIVQDILSGKNRPKKQKHLVPLRGLLFCAKCGCMLTATIAKGHMYYYCTNSKGGCDQRTPYITSDEINKMVAQEFTKIGFEEKIIQIMYESGKQLSKNDEVLLETSREAIEQQLISLQGKQQKLLDAYLNETVSEEAYNAKILSLNNNEVELRTQLKQFHAKELRQAGDTFEQTKKAFLTGSFATFDFLNGDDLKKYELAQILLSNIKILNQKIQQTQFKPEYQLMAEAPKNGDLKEWLGRQGSNLGMQASKARALPLGYAPIRSTTKSYYKINRVKREAQNKSFYDIINYHV